MLPLPFTLSAVIILVAASISKLQYQASQIVIAAHALLGPLETVALIYTLVTYLGKGYQDRLVFILFLVAISLLGMFNFFAFAIQTPFIVEDRQFLKWMRRRQQRLDAKFNFYWFYLITVLSLLTNFKLKYLLFSSLFNFDCLKCKLQSVEKFRIFNIFSFLALISEIITLYCAIVTILAIDSADSFFLVLLDMIIIFVLNILFSVLAANKSTDFFKEELEGISINQVYNVPEQSFQSSIAIGGKSAFGRALEDIIELDEFAYRTTTREAAEVKNREGEVTEKISECTQEQNTVKTSQRSEVEKIENVSGEIIQECHNILMIDEVYGFDQYLPEPPDLDQVEYIRQIAQPQECLEIPKVKPQTTGMEEPQSEEPQNHQQEESNNIQKTERINLAEYLQKLQQLQRKTISAVPKYYKLTAQGNLPQALMNGLNSSLIEDLKAVQTQKKYTFEERYHQLSEQSSVTQKITDAMYKVQSSTPSQGKDHRLAQFGQSVKRVVTLHNFERKQIAQENEDSNLRRYRRVTTANIRLNEDHGEEPIRNKSKDKFSVYENNPIRDRSPPHPINNQRSGAGYHKLLQQQESDDRVKVRGTKMRTQTIPVTKFGNSHQKVQESSPRNLEKYQSVKTQDPDVQQKFNHKQKQFKRSSPQIRIVFPANNHQSFIRQEHSIGDRVPRKPAISTAPRPWSSQSKSVENMRGVSFAGERKKRSKKAASFDKNLTGLDRRKMKSLEKIYLDKQ